MPTPPPGTGPTGAAAVRGPRPGSEHLPVPPAPIPVFREAPGCAVMRTGAAVPELIFRGGHGVPLPETSITARGAHTTIPVPPGATAGPQGPRERTGARAVAAAVPPEVSAAAAAATVLPEASGVRVAAVPQEAFAAAAGAAVLPAGALADGPVAGETSNKVLDSLR